MKKATPNRFMTRQGDVYIQSVPVMPDGLKAVSRDAAGRFVLAHGEATGHAHAILDAQVEMRESADGTLYLRIVGDAPATLRHEEHAPVSLPPGDYRVTRQSEYDPAEIREVVD